MVISTCCAEKFVVFRLLVCLFGIVFLAVMLAEFSLGTYSVVGTSVISAVNSNSTDHFPADVNRTIAATWNACCTHDYNITIEYDIPSHHHDNRGPHMHTSSDDWITTEYNDTSGILTVHADVEDICNSIEKVYQDRGKTLQCTDYVQFRTGFLDWVYHILLPCAVISFLTGVMSLITFIFSTCIACYCRRTESHQPASGYSATGASAPLMVNSGVGYV
jgi:hypothetical protein